MNDFSALTLAALIGFIFGVVLTLMPDNTVVVTGGENGVAVVHYKDSSYRLVKINPEDFADE